MLNLTDAQIADPGKLGKHDESLVLRIHNVHFESCGRPPGIVKRADDGLYIGFFAGACGGQLVIEIDTESNTGQVFVGDQGWERPVSIENSRVIGGIIFGDDEAQWVALCWRTATGEELQGIIHSQGIRRLIDAIGKRNALEAAASKPRRRWFHFGLLLKDKARKSILRACKFMGIWIAIDHRNAARRKPGTQQWLVHPPRRHPPKRQRLDQPFTLRPALIRPQRLGTWIACCSCACVPV